LLLAALGVKFSRAILSVIVLSPEYVNEILFKPVGMLVTTLVLPITVGPPINAKVTARAAVKITTIIEIII
jgi:hypothetical protein